MQGLNNTRAPALTTNLNQQLACRDEFTNFMFLERAQAGGDVGDADNWRLFPADFRDGNVKASSSSMHHEQVGLFKV